MIQMGIQRSDAIKMKPPKRPASSNLGSPVAQGLRLAKLLAAESRYPRQANWMMGSAASAARNQTMQTAPQKAASTA